MTKIITKINKKHLENTNFSLELNEKHLSELTTIINSDRDTINIGNSLYRVYLNTKDNSINFKLITIGE